MSILSYDPENRIEKIISNSTKLFDNTYGFQFISMASSFRVVCDKFLQNRKIIFSVAPLWSQQLCLFRRKRIRG